MVTRTVLALLTTMLFWGAVPALAPAQQCTEGLDVLESQLNFNDDLTIESLTTSVDLTCPIAGDLALFMTSPEGTSVVLYLHGGGREPDLLLEFSDDGIPHGDDSFTCDCQMQIAGPGLLSDFNYERTLGNWLLQVIDLNPDDDEPILNQWCLDVVGCELQPPTDLMLENPGEIVWVNNDPQGDYAGIDILVDDELLESLDPEANSFDLQNLDSGYHSIRVVAVGDDCASSSKPLIVGDWDRQVCSESAQFLDPVDAPDETTHDVTLDGPEGADEITLERLDVLLELFAFQMELWEALIESPLGTAVTLFDGTVEPGPGPMRMIFSDFGEELLPPYDCGLCTRLPVGPGSLSDYKGETSSGEWLLQLLSAEPGELDSACINFFEECPVLPPTDLEVYMELDALLIEWVNEQVYESLILEMRNLSLQGATPFSVVLDPEAESFTFLPDEPGLWEFFLKAAAEGSDCTSRSPLVTLDIFGEERGADLYASEYWDFIFGEDNLPALPAGFFGTGSEEFVGTIPMQGNPPGWRGPFELGDTDTVLRRLDAVLFDDDAFGPDTSNQVGIQIEQLELKSADPITVVTNGADVLWDVEVALSDDPPTPGVLTVERTHSNGGTFHAQFFVKPVFTFTTNEFLRGDANYDFLYDIADPIKCLEVLFLDGVAICPDSVDANDDGLLDLEDFFYSVNYLFRSGDEPPAPWAEPGPDLTADDLDCDIKLQLALDETDVEGDGVWDTEDSCPTDDLRVNGLPIGSCKDDLELSGVGIEAELRAASEDPDRPEADIDATAFVDELVGSIGRNAVVSAGVIVGPGVVIGPGAFIGEDVELTMDVIVGENTSIGDGTVLLPRSVVGSNATVGENCVAGEDATVIATCELADNVVLNDRARLGSGCVVGEDVEIGTGADIRSDVTIGEGVTITDGVLVMNGATIEEFLLLEDDLLPCTETLDDGSNVGTAEDCEDADGAVIGTIPTGRLRKPGELKSETKIKEDKLPEELKKIFDDAAGAGDSDTTDPIKDRKYVKDTYDCDDFAHDLERALQDDGNDDDDEPDDYDSTFTVYWRWRIIDVWDWWNDRWTKEWENYEAHAVTDIHAANGIMFIEPQTGKYIDLDFDQDGKVEYETTHGIKFTEGKSRIEVYPDRAAAVKAGVILD